MPVQSLLQHIGKSTGEIEVNLFKYKIKFKIQNPSKAMSGRHFSILRLLHGFSDNLCPTTAHSPIAYLLADLHWTAWAFAC